MTRKKLAVTSLLLTLCTVIIGFFAYELCFNGKPTECTFARIHAGMTLNEVVAIMGPGVEVQSVPTLAQHRVVNGRRTINVVYGDRYFVWQIDADESFWISFVEGKVAEKHHSFLPLF